MSGGLRIGLVCPYSLDSPGGVQNHVLGLARFLRAAGHHPYVLAPGDVGPAASLLGPEQVSSAGSTVPVRYNGSIARVNFGPRSAVTVHRWLGGHQLDLLHIHEPITPSIALLALRAARVPVVATYHTATPRSRTMQLAGSVLRGAVAKIDAGIAVSPLARDVVVRHLGRDALIVPNGIAVAEFGRPRTVRRVPGRPRLVFLGRVDEPRKGLDVLLAALPRLTARHPGLEVVVAGAGVRRLPPGCRRISEVDDGAKAALLAGADVFVAPHRERESFGIVVLEAMAAGAPVVASDLDPFVELLTDPDGRRLGELFSAGQPMALADAVTRVLTEPDADRTRRARRRAAAYDWSVVGPAVAGVYATALGRGVMGLAPQKDLLWPGERDRSDDDDPAWVRARGAS